KIRVRNYLRSLPRHWNSGCQGRRVAQRDGPVLLSLRRRPEAVGGDPSTDWRNRVSQTVDWQPVRAGLVARIRACRTLNREGSGWQLGFKLRKIGTYKH